MTFINNVSYESGDKTTASIHFVNLFPFYTKIKTSNLLRVGNKKPAKKNFASSEFFWVFFNFLFFCYLKAFYINYINSNSITKHITLL